MSTSTRGFGSMPKARLKEVSSKGGQRAQDTGKVRRWTKGSPEARAAGRKGGMATS